MLLHPDFHLLGLHAGVKASVIKYNKCCNGKTIKYFLLLDNSEISCNKNRDVAQSGSAPEWGSGGREFKSRRPDQQN